MYKIVFRFLLFFLALGVEARSQGRFEDFNNFVFRNIKIPDTLKYDCTWHFAIIKMSVNQDGRVIDYKFLNKEQDSFIEALKFIKNYKFKPTSKIKNRPVIFYLAFDTSDICNFKSSKNDIGNKEYISQELLKYIGNEIDSNPRTLIMPTPINIKYLNQKES